MAICAIHGYYQGDGTISRDCPECLAGDMNKKPIVFRHVGFPCPSCAILRAAKESAEAQLCRAREALNIPLDEVGRIMHESWTRTKRAQGFHHPGYHNDPIGGALGTIPRDKFILGGNRCPWCHDDLIPWSMLPEKQKDINRHAFDDVLAELRRRAGL